MHQSRVVRFMSMLNKKIEKTQSSNIGRPVRVDLEFNDAGLDSTLTEYDLFPMGLARFLFSKHINQLAYATTKPLNERL